MPNKDCSLQLVIIEPWELLTKLAFAPLNGRLIRCEQTDESYYLAIHVALPGFNWYPESRYHIGSIRQNSQIASFIAGEYATFCYISFTEIPSEKEASLGQLLATWRGASGTFWADTKILTLAK